jgi:hypothetical protein
MVKIKIEPEFKVGELVSYYSEGQRAGYIEQIKKDKIKIKPIGPKDANIHSKWINLELVEKV